MTRRMTSLAVAGLGLAMVGGGLAYFLMPGKPAPTASQAAKAEAAESPLRIIAKGLERGEPGSLSALVQRLVDKADQPPTALGDADAADWVAVLQGLRGGFLKYPPLGKGSSIAASTHILDKFRVEPAPRDWSATLAPIHDILTAGMADANVDVRATALNEVGKIWNWLPGRSMTRIEEDQLDAWKDGFHAPAARLLGDRDPKARAAAVGCIGSLPIEALAEPAAKYVADPDSGHVRYKAMMVLAARPNLLAVDAVLHRLHDHEPGIPELAKIILKARGLTEEQIFLGGQMYDDRPEIRASVIPLLSRRTDIDVAVWLLQLSHDADETVRARAVEALAERDSPEVLARLREMARTDASPAIRAAAGKISAKAGETTAALPPLPGSPSLNPKAN